MEVSRALVAAEALFILAPITGLCGIFCTAFLFLVVPLILERGPQPLEIGVAVVLLVSCYALASSWVIAWQFLSFGKARLPSVATHWWLGAAIGVVVVASSALGAILGFELPPFWFGAPAIVPLAHVALERATSVG
jgi:hypothetical protein